MFRDRVERVAPPLAAILLLCTLGLGPGCEEETSVRPEDQLFSLSLPTNSACPSLTTVSPHFATIEITGTVFAADGQVAEGVPVIFSASPVGTFEPTTVATDARGQATVVLTTPRPPGGESNPQNLVTITGTPETGGTQIRQISVPLPPAVGYAPSITQPAVGATFTIDVYVGQACNVRKLEGEFSWDSSRIELLGSCPPVPADATPAWVEYNVLNDLDEDGTIQRNAEVTCSVLPDYPESGRSTLRYSYQRGVVGFPEETLYHAANVHGTNQPGRYVGFVFRVRQAGEADLALEGRTVVTPSDEATALGLGTPYVSTVTIGDVGRRGPPRPNPFPQPSSSATSAPARDRRSH